MSALSKILRLAQGNRLHFWCPGCNEAHGVNFGKDPDPHPFWTWNGNAEKPTFTPSILIRSGHYIPEQANEECWCTYAARTGEESPFKCTVCHSFVTDGRIQFLGDCTHALAGITVDIPEWTEKEPGC